VRILVLGTNYAPERTAVAPFTTGLCEHLAEQGHDIKVITTFPYYPEWRIWEGYRGLLFRREQVRNVCLLRVWHFVPGRASSLVQRLAHDFSFACGAFLASPFAGNFDMIYCVSPPPALALAAYLLAAIRRKPYIIKLTDLASDAARATGILGEGVALRLARAIERFIYRHAARVVCLCQGFIERLSELGISPDKLELIPDWAGTQDAGSFSGPFSGNGAFRKANGFAEEQFLVMHTGNIGKKQNLMNAVRAAEISRDRSDLVWVVVGDGEERSAIGEEIRARGLANIRLLPFEPAERLPEMYSSADALLLNQKASVESAVIPSKLLTYMAAGRAVLAAVSEKSEAARLVRGAQCGLLVPAENPQALVDAALLLRENSSLRLKLGSNGRAYAARHFTKQSVLRAYDALFSRLANEKPLETAAARKAAAGG